MGWAKARQVLRATLLRERTLEWPQSSSQRADREAHDTMSEEKGLRERVTRQGEEAIGKLAQELLENSVVSGALSAAFETRERALRAQEAAMGALNLPSANDLERLTRRLRGVSQRLEAIEDGLDRLEQRIENLGASTAIDQRLAGIEAALQRVESAVAGSGPAAGSPPDSGPGHAAATDAGPGAAGPRDAGTTII
jgi:chromosome segregation ATPase